MLIHIVKTGETVDRIVDSYRILKNDLISNNLHITDFSHLKSGMKLKIPLLSKDNIETLEETEAFIDDYYPSFEKFLNNNEKLNYEKPKEVNIKTEEIETIKEVDDSQIEPDVENTNSNEDLNCMNDDNSKNQSSYNEKSYNKNIYFQRGMYCGNVIPAINNKYIKKI